jgi:hypothetical protein
MLTLKSQLTCSYCSKIFRDPILLPCGDSICRDHLKDRDVVKANRIKCKKCNDEFQIKDNEFNTINDLNTLIKTLVESRCYLSAEELSLKKVLEDSMRKFFHFYDEFNQNKSILESNVYDHFQEMRFQIDEHRERLTEKSDATDEIALAMIDESKKYEEMFLKNLKERFQVNFSSFEKSKPLEGELNEIEELFRDPDLLIQSIREMQQKQEKSLNEFQSKLNEMNQVKDDLKLTNGFKPNVSQFNQEDLFGSLKLNEFCPYMNSFKSQILKGEQQSIDLIALCEFSPNDKWSLLYRGTRDGFGGTDFHSNCDGHTNTLTILKAKESKFIFGGFTSAIWESPAYRGIRANRGKYKSDGNAFIFSLTNKENKPLNMKVNPDHHQYAIWCHSRYGPTFGCIGHDICIYNSAHTTSGCFSNLGHSYEHPQFAYGTDEARIFLAGSEYFQLDEIEVYGKE